MMITRRKIVTAIGACALGASRAGLAQTAPPAVRRIGILSPIDQPTYPVLVDALRRLGYEDGKNAQLLLRSAKSDYGRLPALARELIDAQVEVIVAINTPGAQAAINATKTIPVIMTLVGDLVGTGFITSLARPGTNITGLSFVSSDLAGKRLEIVREMVPRARTVAILFDARNANARLELAAALDAARQLKLAASTYELQNEGAILSARDGAHAAKADLLYAVFEGNIAARRRYELAAYALWLRRPMVSGWSGITDAGGLISYAPAIAPMFRRAAYYVHRLLQGAQPNDLPVEQPTLFETVVNAVTAKRFGIKLPESILLRAGRVIE